MTALASHRLPPVFTHFAQRPADGEQQVLERDEAQQQDEADHEWAKQR